MVLKGGLGGARREGSTGEEVFNELVILRERRQDVERDGVFHNEGNVGSLNDWGGHWSEEWMVNLHRPQVLLSVSSGRLW